MDFSDWYDIWKMAEIFQFRKIMPKHTENKVDESASEFLEMYPELHSKHRTIN